MDHQGKGKGKFNDGKGKGERDWAEEKGDRKGDRKGTEKGKRNGDGRSKGEKGEKGDKGDRKGEGKGEGKGDKGGKGKREVKVVAKGLRGKITTFVNGKPSGFIQRTDGEKDVFFDLADVVDGETLERDDIVEFDIVEGLDKKLYGSRVKKLPKETDLKEESQVLKSTTVHMASKAGSLTGGGLTLGPTSRLGGSGKLSGPVSLRPGGSLAPPAGAAKPKETKEVPEELPQDQESCLWGRIVNVYGGFGFLKKLGDADGQDIFFRAADVIGMNSLDPGSPSTECLEIVQANTRNSNGFKKFYITLEDEVSFVMSKDHTGKPCAAAVMKERKGAWRTSTGRRRIGVKEVKKETFKDQVNRLTSMDTDQILQSAMFFKEILDSPEFDGIHLYKVVSMLASKDLLEDTRADRIYRLFLESSAMQACLRTTIIKQGAGRHNGNFLEECLKVIVEIVMRSPASQELRGQLPLVELVEAWENSVRGGSTVARKGLSEDVVSMLKCLGKHFPEEVSLDRVLGAKAPKKQRTVADDAAEILEASHYQEMPILPTSAEMIGHCAFEVQENMQTYEKCVDYIQTHFMLLREDYIEPLRAGIKLFMQGRHSPKDLHVYTGVKVVGVLSTWEGLVYRIELRPEETRKINWEKSKQLMYGSLLCFSDDDFSSLIWATVWRRDPALISGKAQLDIRLPFDPWDDRLSPGKMFCCIENVTIYFEAYRHVLIALQNMRAADVPFQQTLLTPQPDALPPTYLKEETDMFHFHNVFSNCEKADAEVAAPKSFRILAEWPPALRQALDLDPSQLDAVQHALTHQMALIQGPPGTGKTFVGLKIVQALLDNTRNLRHSPILVVCFTNHALDQFLEGIFKFCESIVRIGSRSKSEQMMRRNLKELVMEVKASREFIQARKSLTDRRDYLRDELVKAMKLVDSHTVSAAQAKSLMSEQQFETFYQGFLDCLGDDKGDFPEDPWVVDDDVWSRVMKEWLGTSDPAKLAPVPIRQEGGLPSFKNFGLEEESDDDDPLFGGKDGDEEEAENEMYERKLDVDNEQTEQVDEKKKPGSRMDFFQELHYAWLPYLEEYYETLTPEMRNLDWRQEDLWRLHREHRRECYRQWLLEAHEEARGILPELAHLLERNAESRAALDRDRKLAVLREMQVVGMTTTAVSKYQLLLKELRPEIVIVEEAAEVLEAHILTALHPRTQHVVLIGDHQQLRPSTAVTLLQQRRMHPKISRLIKPYYPQLRDHSSTERYPEIRGINARSYFMTHFHFEDDEGESHSHLNTFEANFVSALCAHLVSCGYEESQITVLSPYLGQVRLLKKRIQRDPTTQQIAVTAVDNFQGEENDIIVISLVRSNRARQMGFLAVENRINVALTRARHGIFIVGNADMLEKHTLWSQILTELKSDQCFGDTLPLVDKEQKGVFEVKSADEISVFLDSKLHETGGEGMMTVDEYRRSLEAKRSKGQKGSRKGKGDPGPRWFDSGKAIPSSSDRGRNDSNDAWERRDKASWATEHVLPRAEADRDEQDAPGKADQDDGKRGKKQKNKNKSRFL